MRTVYLNGFPAGGHVSHQLIAGVVNGMLELRLLKLSYEQAVLRGSSFMSYIVCCETNRVHGISPVGSI